ncbi:MAG: FHA domain-containing protein [Pseudomonadota bacterium]
MTLSIQIIQVPPAETIPKREFYLSEFPVNIGRDYAADVCLPDLSEEMSRSHLLIFKSSTGRYQVTDVSTNGATLNGNVIPPKKAVSLVDGDVLGFIGYKLLVGILTAASNTDEEPSQPHPKLYLGAEFSTDAPLLPDSEIEQTHSEPDEVFSQNALDLDPELMFDPFADGPAIDETAAQQSPGLSRNPNEVEFAEIVPLPEGAAQNAHAPELLETIIQAKVYRENVNQAIERAVDRFLDELDPAALQKDYDEYMPRFGRRKARYWSIHLRQFEKRKLKGGFRRSFMALFAEEIRKL